MSRRAALSLTMLFASLAIAQEPPPSIHTVSASGEATLTAKPDRAEIYIAVSTQAPTAQQTSSQNAEETTHVLKAIKPVLGSAGEIRTTGYSVVPDYQYPKNGSPHIAGYHAENTVLVTVDDLPLTGKVIDAATQSGANQITGISFTLRNDAAIRAQALAEASVRARAAAEAIAKALNLRIVGVWRAESSEVIPPRPLRANAGFVARSAEVATPIESGTIDIHATVTVTLQVQ